MKVNSLVSRTELIQSFVNVSQESTPEAHYTFPLYDGATIVAFQAEIGNSEVLEGRALPKAGPKEEYKRATEKMEAAAIVEEHTPEVFETRVGNIPPKTVAKVTTTYTNQLEEDFESPGVIVTIPTSIAPRYGQAPDGCSTSDEMPVTDLKIAVHVSSASPIKQPHCTTHPISIEMGTSGASNRVSSFAELAKGTAKEDFDTRKSIARLADANAMMGRDFVLRIVTSPPDVSNSSCALLSAPDAHGLSSLIINVKSNELFDGQEAIDLFSGEIVFLADRSGSMAGSKINSLRDALNVFLKSLPSTCYFNLASFGDHFSCLWQSSRAYGSDTLKDAMAHVATFEGNMGGTQLLLALKKVVSRRNKGLASSQIIVLTDGEVWETEETIDFGRQTTSESSHPTRFFSLGIGNEVSHRLIMGIGKAGGGRGATTGMDRQGKWQEKVIDMLANSLAPQSWTVEVIHDPKFALATFQDAPFLEWDSTSDSDEAKPVQYIQAPSISTPVHQFGQAYVYQILD